MAMLPFPRGEQVTACGELLDVGRIELRCFGDVDDRRAGLGGVHHRGLQHVRPLVELPLEVFDIRCSCRDAEQDGGERVGEFLRLLGGELEPARAGPDEFDVEPGGRLWDQAVRRSPVGGLAQGHRFAAVEG
jgi:hypothetical protein